MIYHIVMKEGFVSHGSDESVWMNKNAEYAKCFDCEETAAEFAKSMQKHFDMNDNFYVIIHHKEA